MSFIGFTGTLIEKTDAKARAVFGDCISINHIQRVVANKAVKLRPEWDSAKDDNTEAEKGNACVVKVIMTGSADDSTEWQQHIRNKDKRRKLANQLTYPSACQNQQEGGGCYWAPRLPLLLAAASEGLQHRSR